MNQEYMKEKPVLPLILSMSTPMMLSMLVQSLYNIIDSIFVAKIGEDALAAVSLVYPLQNLITALTVGFGVGMNARIAFYLGAGEKEKADTATSQGIFLGTVHGILVTIAGLFFAPVYLRMYTQDERVLSWSIAYANIIFGMSALLVVGVTFEKVYQAEGKMVTTMTGMMAGCIANIILDPLMIFGIGFFPKMGVQGAAVATGLGWVVTLGYYLWYYFSGRVTLKIRMKEMRPTKEISVRMYQVGIPATLNMALPSLLISALNGMLAVYSQMYVVILGIYFKLQSFIYLPANGIVQGMRPLLSYNYGAGEKERVRKIFRICLELIAGIMCIGMLVCLCLPQELMGMFTNNSQTIAEGAKAAPHHQPWICDLRGISSLCRSIRGTWKRNVLISHYTFKVCSDHIAGSLYRKSFLGSNGSLECIRDRRNADGNRRHINMEKTENVEKCKKSVNVSIDNLQINDILDNVL